MRLCALNSQFDQDFHYFHVPSTAQSFHFRRVLSSSFGLRTLKVRPCASAVNAWFRAGSSLASICPVLSKVHQSVQTTRWFGPAWGRVISRWTRSSATKQSTRALLLKSLFNRQQACRLFGLAWACRKPRTSFVSLAQHWEKPPPCECCLQAMPNQKAVWPLAERRSSRSALLLSCKHPFVLCRCPPSCVSAEEGSPRFFPWGLGEASGFRQSSFLWGLEASTWLRFRSCWLHPSSASRIAY